MRWIAALCLCLLLAAGCDGDSTDGRFFELPPYYQAYDSPDHLIANLAAVWERMDLAEYRDSVLYDGNEAATDGNTYAPFKFYYDRSLDPTLPVLDLYEREVLIATNMCGGLPGAGVPGFKSISVTFTPIGDWADPEDPIEVEGDPYPPGTQWRRYAAHIVITLKANIGDTNINTWLVEDHMIFHLIPIRVENLNAPGTYHTRYRLWKWREVIDGRVASTSWGAIKALYAQ